MKVDRKFWNQITDIDTYVNDFIENCKNLIHNFISNLTRNYEQLEPIINEVYFKFTNINFHNGLKIQDLNEVW